MLLVGEKDMCLVNVVSSCRGSIILSKEVLEHQVGHTGQVVGLSPSSDLFRDPSPSPSPFPLPPFQRPRACSGKPKHWMDVSPSVPALAPCRLNLGVVALVNHCLTREKRIPLLRINSQIRFTRPLPDRRLSVTSFPSPSGIPTES